MYSSRALLEIVFPKFVKYCPILRTEEKKFPIMVDDESCHLSCYTLTHASIWHRCRDYGASKITWSPSWLFGGHVTSSITWPFDSR